MQARPPRSLWPREHGAYVQLSAPLATALALHAPSAAGLLVALGACLAFLAHEPLLVVLGYRGDRIRKEQHTRAPRRLTQLTIAAVLTGGAGLVLAPRVGIATASVVAVPAIAVLALAWRRAEHSLLGEIVAAIALAGAAAPVSVAGGLPWHDAAKIWLVWSVGFACTIIAVHRVIARHRRGASWPDRLAVIVLGLTTAAGAVIAAAEPAAVSITPLAAISTLLVVAPPRATHLRAVGVALVVASVASGVLLVVTL